jgi:hypothetical protein
MRKLGGLAAYSARDVALCEGLRMPASEGGAACTGAGVRKPNRGRYRNRLERFKQRIRETTRRAKASASRRQWKSWLRICGAGAAISASAKTPEVLIALTRWDRLRLRAALWREWKAPRRRRTALIALGVSGELRNTAGSGRGPWHIAQSKALSVGLSNAHFKSLGLLSLVGSALA